MHLALRYALALGLVGAGTVLAYIGLASGIQTQTLALAYVVPVSVAAAYLGWGPAILGVVASVAVFDFLFTVPYFTLNVASRSDIAAMALLAIVAAIVSTVAAEARHRALDARAAAERADALRSLAHATIHGEADAALFRIAAETLARVFKAPAVIYAENNGVVSSVASAGGARVSPSDREAAQWAISHETPVQGDTYPFD
jgi:two-component system sensor histidine kinase KdpD